MPFVSFGLLKKQKQKMCAKTSVYFQLKTSHQMRTTFCRQCTKNENKNFCHLIFWWHKDQIPRNFDYHPTTTWNSWVVVFSCMYAVCIRYTQPNIWSNIYSHLWFECAYTHSICVYPTLFAFSLFCFTCTSPTPHAYAAHTYAPLSIFLWHAPQVT